MSPRILVVDDEPSLRRGITYALERERVEVKTVTNGEAAVTVALTNAVSWFSTSCSRSSPARRPAGRFALAARCRS